MRLWCWVAGVWRKFERGEELNRRGLRALGRVWMASKSNRPQREVARLIRYANRLFRLEYNGNPWKPYRGH